MADILHRVGIRSSREDAYKALATRDGLAAWWTNDTRGDSEVDGVLEFRCAPHGGCDRKVLEHWKACPYCCTRLDAPPPAKSTPSGSPPLTVPRTKAARKALAALAIAK
jgi:hypothetical protein